MTIYLKIQQGFFGCVIIGKKWKWFLFFLAWSLMARQEGYCACQRKIKGEKQWKYCAHFVSFSWYGYFNVLISSSKNDVNVVLFFCWLYHWCLCRFYRKHQALVNLFLVSISTSHTSYSHEQSSLSLLSWEILSFKFWFMIVGKLRKGDEDNKKQGTNPDERTIE